VGLRGRFEDVDVTLGLPVGIDSNLRNGRQL
jgi:hypothetical protein